VDERWASQPEPLPAHSLSCAPPLFCLNFQILHPNSPLLYRNRSRANETAPNPSWVSVEICRTPFNRRATAHPFSGVFLRSPDCESLGFWEEREVWSEDYLRPAVHSSGAQLQSARSLMCQELFRRIESLKHRIVWVKCE
jgi:hypothetical protein